MDISGEYRIPAPRPQVWEALNDPDVLGQCIPGCESIEKTSDTEMNAVVQAKVGPVSAKFSGAVTLEDMDPPNGYTIRGEGKGGVAGFAKGTARVDLADEGDATLLTYKVDATVGGKLAQVGARLVGSTVRKMADEFFGRFSEIVGGAGEASAPAAEPAAAPEAPPSSRADEPAAPARPDSGEIRQAAASSKVEKSWGSPFTIGFLVIAAILVIYFLVT
ncbi:MAG: carbon monoxide dehydrogenase [Alphaproteobacteria bacterium]|nr:carbon monoxide dehydrogenase [Alphaproteobacteria bacterium]